MISNYLRPVKYLKSLNQMYLMKVQKDNAMSKACDNKL